MKKYGIRDFGPPHYRPRSRLDFNGSTDHYVNDIGLTGKIDDDTWSQISERMLLKNAERVEHYTRGPPPKKKDAFTFDVDNETEFVYVVKYRILFSIIK